MVSYMSFFSDIPDGNNICSAVKSATVEEIVSGIRYGIANLHDRKDACRFGLVLCSRNREDVERLCRQELKDIEAELLSKHYLLTIVSGGAKYVTRCEKLWSGRSGTALSKNYLGAGDTVIVVEATEKDNMVSTAGLNLSENGNVRL